MMILIFQLFNSPCLNVSGFFILFFLKSSLKHEYLGAVICYSTPQKSQYNEMLRCIVSLLFSSDLLTCTKIPVTLQPHTQCLCSCHHLNFLIITVSLVNLSYSHVAFIFGSVCMILHQCAELCISCTHRGCLLQSEVAVGFWSTSCSVSAVKRCL